MKLKTLKPRIQTANLQRVSTMTQRVGATERTRGRAWMEVRAWWLRTHPACANCGRLHYTNQVDHVVPLWDGGADDETNFQTLCVTCHEAKTAGEAKRRPKG